MKKVSLLSDITSKLMSFPELKFSFKKWFNCETDVDLSDVKRGITVHAEYPVLMLTLKNQHHVEFRLDL